MRKLAVTYRDAESLRPYQRNARTHSDEQIAQIVASIKEFGFTNPILVDGENGIIAGHGRLMAANKLGMKQVPTIELSGLSEAQKRAYVLADNKLALNAGWDLELLGGELRGLAELGFDCELTGFDGTELEALMAEKTEGLTDPDDTPEPPLNPVTELGEVWLLGKHRIVCGDSTDADVVAKCLNGVAPHLMVTDPPYGVEYDAEWRKGALPETNPGKSGGMHGKVQNDNRADWSEAWALFPGDVAYVWHAGVKSAEVQQSLEACGFQVRAQIIWAKHQSVIGRGHYHVQHEPCFYLVKKGGTGHWGGSRKQHTLWQIDKPRNSETGHSTQKPVECMKRPIENNSSPGQAVYEPFSGSGTTIIAAEMTGRVCHAIELSPAYVDVAVKRWQEFTGEQATLEGDGRSFDEIAGERGGESEAA
jgi:DNA modification methylase